MSADRYERIKQNPKFHQLATRRSRFAWTLSVLILLMYFSFILAIAFFPHLLGHLIHPGSPITVGIPIGIAIIFIAFVLTGIYVHRANTVFDRITREIIEESQQ